MKHKCDVIVTAALAKGATREEADMDEQALGDHEFSFTVADTLDEQYISQDSLELLKQYAEARALDAYHGSFPIGVLDLVEIDTTVTLAKQ